jgi:hypothetical protein
MAAVKLSEGDAIGMTGEVTRVNDDGTVTVRLHGLHYPVTTTGEHLSMIAKRQPAEQQEDTLRQAGLNQATIGPSLPACPDSPASARFPSEGLLPDPSSRTASSAGGKARRYWPNVGQRGGDFR